MSVIRVDHGRVTYFELFEGDDAGAALERFEEIGAQTEPERISPASAGW